METEQPLPLSPVLQFVASEALALRKLARTNGCSTRRSQNQLLQQLDDADLALVSLALQQAEERAR
jgi:hypothetical protein